MKQFRRLVPCALLFAALAAVLCAGHTRPAAAYFTTYVSAKGTAPLPKMESEHEFDEEVVVESMTKIVNIANTTDAPRFVRVKAYAPVTVELQYSSKEWVLKDDGYCYYPEVLNPGDKVRPLVIKIVTKKEQPTDFNVAVISESVPALYKADGTVYASWPAED